VQRTRQLLPRLNGCQDNFPPSNTWHPGHPPRPRRPSWPPYCRCLRHPLYTQAVSSLMRPPLPTQHWENTAPNPCTPPSLFSGDSQTKWNPETRITSYGWWRTSNTSQSPTRPPPTFGYTSFAHTLPARPATSTTTIGTPGLERSRGRSSPRPSSPNSFLPTRPT
jgi:hypothetical protein